MENKNRKDLENGQENQSDLTNKSFASKEPSSSSGNKFQGTGDSLNVPQTPGAATVQSTSDTKLQRRKEEDLLGADIIDECRTQLMMKFRFLDMALWRMDLEPSRFGAMYPLATDGKRVLFDPPRVIGRFQQSYDETIRDYLHMVVHCIFRHPYDKNKRNKEAWNLTCDIITEAAIIDLVGERFKSSDDLARMMELSRIKMAAGALTPGKVYKFIEQFSHMADGQELRGIPTSKLGEWRALFERDDHGAWPMHAKAEQSDDTSDQSDEDDFSENDDSNDLERNSLRTDNPEGQSAEDSRGQRDRTEGENDSSDDASNPGQSAGQNEQENDQEDSDQDESEEDNNQEDQGSGSDGADGNKDTQNDIQDEANDKRPPQSQDDSSEQDEKEWEEISKQIEMNLHTFSKEWGDEAGSLMANLQAANKRTHDYSDFLRRFATVNEEMQINMDEFDNIFYTFGMDLYGNMPLVEPLEYKETERIRDFVIAIDTSESVSGKLVKQFIQQTFEILKSSEEFSHKVNIHVIQADSKVQSDVLIEDLKDSDKFLDGFQVRGFGGTDFRPAFDYVEMLQAREKITDLKGMIYFTDGYGSFPEKAPEFDAAFVFFDDGEREIPPVPPWAIKLVLDETSFENN